MAYSLGDRFPAIPKYYTLLDPAAYQYESSIKQLCKAPFFSKAPRDTLVGNKIWTETIYDATTPRKIIPNCTSFLTKCPRFPYEALSKEDFEEILCKCGIPCDCPTEETEQKTIICQGKLKRRLYKGHSPRKISSDEGLSVPSKRDCGFDLMPDGSKRRIRSKILVESPPFYDARVLESTMFYQGCKWSQRTSKRSAKTVDTRPGPADYTFEKQLTDTEKCSEKLRAVRRKYSRQPRFIEIIQQKNISEGRPGPSTYSPTLLKGTNLQFLGSKSKRFHDSSIEIRPGPADHSLRRDFDKIDSLEKPCHANLPERSCFGIKALRFKPKKAEGPGPATYSASYRICQFLHCSKAPFGSTAKRFKENLMEESDDEVSDAGLTQNTSTREKRCQYPSWQFKSKRIRMKPLEKIYNQPSPADLPQSTKIIKRSKHLQNVSPFNSSESRFQPWYNWIPVHGKEKTPGPAYYSLEKPECLPAVSQGPLCRAPRFFTDDNKSPSPNEYNVGRGIEMILRTSNQKLLYNIENQHIFHWKPPKDTRIISCSDREESLLQKSIFLLDEGIFNAKDSSVPVSLKRNTVEETKKAKMLRCFVHGSKVPPFF